MSALILRRDWLLGLAASCATFANTRPAPAGAALPISLPELVHRSRFAVVGTARHATSQWERNEEGTRIVTLTRLEIVQSLDGRPLADSEVTIRTLGGTVGEVGQIVHGEAELERDRPAVFFLQEASTGAHRITAMAQGHYALRPDTEGTYRLLPSPKLPDFFAVEPRSAVSRLRGRSVADCERLVLEALSETP